MFNCFWPVGFNCGTPHVTRIIVVPNTKKWIHFILQINCPVNDETVACLKPADSWTGGGVFGDGVKKKSGIGW